jgi:ribosomal protein S27AE
MASVQDSIDCPQCSGKAFLEFHTRTLEESIFCARCGYSEYTRPIIDRQKQNADSEHHAWFKRRKDGEPIYRTTKRAGFGAYLLAQQNGVSVLGVVNCKLTPRMIANFKRDIARPEIDAARSFLTRWNPKHRCVEAVVGQIPSDFP